MMRILLTGACGMLARAIRKVGANDHQFVLIDVIEDVVAEGGSRVSVTDLQAVKRAAEGCDAIIHTAAMHGRFRGKATNQAFIETNVIGAENLFEAAFLHSIRRLVMSSTLEVIYGVNCESYGTAVTDEDTPPRPDWIYPVTKQQVEILSSHYVRDRGLQVVNLRYANIISAPVEKLGFQLLARGTHAEDYAHANLLAATVPGLTEHILHCAPETPLTRYDIHKAMADPWPTLDKYWPGSSDVLKAKNLVPSPVHFWPVTRIDRARQVLGWRPRITFADFLRHHGWQGQPAFQIGQ